MYEQMIQATGKQQAYTVFTGMLDILFFLVITSTSRNIAVCKYHGTLRDSMLLLDGCYILRASLRETAIGSWCPAPAASRPTHRDGGGWWPIDLTDKSGHGWSYCCSSYEQSLCDIFFQRLIHLLIAHASRNGYQLRDHTIRYDIIRI